MISLVEGQEAQGWETTLKGSILDRLTREIVDDRFIVEKTIDGMLLSDDEPSKIKFGVSVSLSRRSIWLYDKKYLPIVGELIGGYKGEFGRMEVVKRYERDS